jgi:hypothetical protein
LRKIEKEIIEENKKYVLQREIMSLVDPSDIIAKQPTEYLKNYQIKKFR